MLVHISPAKHWIFVSLDLYVSYFEIPYLVVMLEIKKHVTCIHLCEVSAHTFGIFVCLKL